jgi:glucose/arabinose dehydrogenase
VRHRQHHGRQTRGDRDDAALIRRLGFALTLVALAACGGGGGGSSTPPAGGSPTPVPSGGTPSPTAKPSTAPSASPTPTATPTLAPTPTPLPGIPLELNLNNLPGPFYGEIAVQMPAGAPPRQMVMLPNGDLLVGTGGGTASPNNQIYIIPNAEAARPGYPKVFATLADIGCNNSAGTNTHGITFAPASGGGTIFVGMECSIWKIPYVTGDQAASSNPTLYIKVRTGNVVAGSDGDVHHTTSVLAVGNTLYVGVGSGCNACTETDPTRAVVLKTDINTPAFTTVATRLRNALALAVNPATGNVWAGGAGQDCQVYTIACFNAMDPAYVGTSGHPYEWMDPVTKHTAPADYMWPWCEEDKTSIASPDPTSGKPPAGTNCNSMIVAPVRGPAYGTIIGATFYSPPAGATYAFPASFQGGLFFSLHGSWHEDQNGVQVALPQVVFVPIAANDTPFYGAWTGGQAPIANWARNSSGNPAPFMNGFQLGGTRYGRPVGLAVGNSGSLFIADDFANEIYRIRPGVGPSNLRRASARGYRQPRPAFVF